MSRASSPLSARPSRLGALLLSLLLATAAFTALAPRALAADLGDVFSAWSEAHGGEDPVRLDLVEGDESGAVEQFEYVAVTADWSLAGTGATAGDSFTLTLPRQFSVDVEDFPLVTPDGAEIGTCSTEMAGGPSVTCTLTDAEYLASHQDIEGWISLEMQAVERTDVETVEFATPAGVLPVPLPGTGGIVGPHVCDRPEEIVKTGWFSAARDRAHWRLHVPGRLVEADVLRIEDEIPAGLTFEDLRVAAVEDTDEGWASYVLEGGRTLGEDEHRWGVVDGVLEVEIPAPDAGTLYIVEIVTRVDEPGALVDGSVFTNAATVDGERYTHTATVRSRGEGGGSGTVLPVEPEPEDPTEPEPPAPPSPDQPTGSEQPAEPTQPAPTDEEEGSPAPPRPSGRTDGPAESPEPSSDEEPGPTSNDDAGSGRSTESASHTGTPTADDGQEPRPERLAETGAQGVGVAIALATVLLAAGGLLLATSRTRHRRR